MLFYKIILFTDRHSSATEEEKKDEEMLFKEVKMLFTVSFFRKVLNFGRESVFLIVLSRLLKSFEAW